MKKRVTCLMRGFRGAALLLGFLLVFGLGMNSVSAATAYWTDWTRSGEGSGADGFLTVGSTMVGVSYSGLHHGNWIRPDGYSYWMEHEDTYRKVGVVDNAPTYPDVIRLNQGGEKTITFSQPVLNPVIGLISWNDLEVDFGVRIEVVQTGLGHWGIGTLNLNPSGTGFASPYGNEIHGVIMLPGIYDSITFTDTNENWHGFTVGVMGLGDAQVPVPAAVWLLGSGILGLAGLRRRMK